MTTWQDARLQTARAARLATVDPHGQPYLVPIVFAAAPQRLFTPLVEAPFAPARKAHPAFLVRDLAALEARLAQAGVAITPDQRVPGVRRCYASDPFGNRLEFIQDGAGFRRAPGPAQ